MAVFLGCTSPDRVGLCFLWFFVQELPKAQPAVVLVLKRLRRRDNGLKSRPTDWEKPGIEPAMPGLQDIGLSLYVETLHYDCPHIEHAHPIFCADSIIFLSVALRHYYIYTTFGVLILCSFSQWLYVRIVSFTYS